MTRPLVDACGKLCPVPLVMTKKVYDPLKEGETMTTKVDNDTSAKNVETFIRESGGMATLTKEGDITSIAITKGAKSLSNEAEAYCPVDGGATMPHVVYVAQNTIGSGEPLDLGAGLMQAFLQTIKDVVPLPSHAIFIHNGVRLLEKGTKTATIIQDLETQGVKIIACGTCLDYLGLMDAIDVGTVSNMYDILTLLSKAGHVVSP